MKTHPESQVPFWGKLQKEHTDTVYRVNDMHMIALLMSYMCNDKEAMWNRKVCSICGLRNFKSNVINFTSCVV